MSQATVVVPNSGIVSGLTFANDVNAALDAIRTSWSGATAPSADAPEEGQVWLDTSVAGYATRKVYDGTSWVAEHTFNLTTHALVSILGGGGLINGGLTASVGSGILTVALTDLNGNVPTASSPVLVPFRNVTATNGLVTWLPITSALQVDTNAIGATLGTSNGVAFRFWIVIFNNSGTPQLALINCLTVGTSGTVFPLQQSNPQSSTPFSATATSPGVFYTETGVTVTSQPICIVGYLEYGGSGLATAGNYTSGPTKLHMFAPGNRLPNDVVQRRFTPTGSVAITPTSECNPVKIGTSGWTTFTTAVSGPFSGTATLQRGASNIMALTFSYYTGVAMTLDMPFAHGILDQPNVNTSITYQVVVTGSAALSACHTVAEEIMV